MKSKQLNIRISNNDLEKLKYMSKVWDTSMSEFIRLLILLEFESGKGYSDYKIRKEVDMGG